MCDQIPPLWTKLKKNWKTIKKQREIFDELKEDDSLNYVRYFEVMRSQKYKENKQMKKQLSSKRNIADEILEVIGMLN